MTTATKPHVESRWPAAIAVLASVGLQAALPPHLTLGPRLLMPLLVLALLIPLLFAGPVRGDRPSRLWRSFGITLIAIVNAANLASLVLLVLALLTPGSKASGLELLASSIAIWFTNILVFGLWYWEMDRGGPYSRLSESTRHADFLFPQMVQQSCAPEHWRPHFLDYLYVAFTNATAFSPTDTMPLTATAKSLMTIQAVISLLTVVLVAARAVNILS